MTEATTTAALKPAYAKGRIALRECESLRAVAKVLYQENHPEVSDDKATGLVPLATKPFPAVPKTQDLTDSQKVALARVKDVFNSVTPTTRRALTKEEMASLFAEDMVLREIVEALIVRAEDIKEIVRHHKDVVAEKHEKADPESTPRDANGHYIMASKGNPNRTDVMGTDKSYSSEFRAGAITISGGDLTDLFDDGEISRSDYLAFTREARVFDESKATAAILAQPERLNILERITHRGADGTSLFVRKAK
jgi:hypothetical protein